MTLRVRDRILLVCRAAVPHARIPSVSFCLGGRVFA